MTTSFPLRPAVGLALLRITTGAIFLMHGYQKLFVMTIPGVTRFFTKAAIPMPGVTASLITLLEFVGGIALVLGLFSHVFALLFVFDMLGAIMFVHLKNGFFAPTGFEFPLGLAVSSLTIAFAGAGAYALDAMIGSRRRDHAL
ncbi:MAG: DoxX family protein [Gemmatimonadota bacterium]|nr:DoxX family protein [Gemmatimonadota bacterium]